MLDAKQSGLAGSGCSATGANEINVYLEIKHETKFAFFVSDGVNEDWLPKSEIKFMRKISGDDWELVITKSIARKKGFLD